MSDFTPEATPKRRCPPEARKSAPARDEAKSAHRTERHVCKSEDKLMTKAINEQRWQDDQ